MNDLKFAFRQLVKNPGFSTVIVSTLGVGIGLNAALFSVVNAVLLRPLPYTDPKRLVAVLGDNPRLGLHNSVVSMGAYADWRGQNSVFQQLAAATVLGPAPISGKGGSELVHTAAVSGGFFQLLGIRPLLGREFIPEEENPDRGDVVLLSEHFWREWFDSNPAVLNQRLRLGERSFTVVGVMPGTVRLFDPANVRGWEHGFSECDLWRPLPVESGLRKQRSYRAFLVLGRLRRGVTTIQAQTEMTRIARAEARDYPGSDSGWTVTIKSWRDTITQNARLPLLLLLGAAGLVLLAATANLANIFLARFLSRRKDFAIRLALGAGKLGIARHLLAESLVLSSLGGAAGLLFAQWGVGVLGALTPSAIPRAGEANLDGRVLLFSVVLTLLAGALFGLAPLLAMAGNGIHDALKSDSRSLTSTLRAGRFRGALVASEVALAMVVLTGAGLLVRSFQRLSEVSPGFQPVHVVALDVLMSGSEYNDESRRIDFVGHLLNRLARLPGVDAAAAVDGLPLDTAHASMDIALTSIDGTTPATADKKLVAGLRLASPNYFRTMGMSLRRGRFFTLRDNTNSFPVVIINRTLARQYLSGSDPLGKDISSPDFGPKPCEIVGVINDVMEESLDAAPKPEVFRPLLQQCFSTVTIVAKSRLAGPQTVARLRKAVGEVDSACPAYNPRTLRALLSGSLARQRFALLLISLFAALALSLAVTGIYAVSSFGVNQCRREIGVRLAFGAQRHQVITLILARGMRWVAVGAAIGLAGALALTRLLRSLLYGISPSDPSTFATVELLVLVAALAACWLPARRAAKVNPMEALRYE
jgi:putative ABC transport system permease protein